MIHYTYATYRKALLNKETTVTETVEYFLENIEQNKDLNVFLEIYEEEALENALLIQEKINTGTAGKLAGMVIGIKDVYGYGDTKVD